jgi:hypothetical protein
MAPEFDLISTYRDWLARGLYCWLEWRAAQAEDRPSDRRYVQAAKSLYLAARDVMALPDDDPRLLRLAHMSVPLVPCAEPLSWCLRPREPPSEKQPSIPWVMRPRRRHAG